MRWIFMQRQASSIVLQLPTILNQPHGALHTSGQNTATDDAMMSAGNELTLKCEKARTTLEQRLLQITNKLEPGGVAS